jgi:predicted DNA-binding transcriptional regulator YafY
LMFDEDELEALVLGARWVERQGDSALAQAATNALAKIAAASPNDLRDTIANTGLWVGRGATAQMIADIKLVREAIRREHKLQIGYVTETGAASARAIWPIAMAFYDRRQTVAAWCELLTRSVSTGAHNGRAPNRGASPI